MRKALLLLSLATAMFCNGQEVDTTTPYYEYEEEVIDTTKAVLMANQMREEKRQQIQNAINELKEQEALLKTLKEKGQKKVNSTDDIKRLKDIAEKYLAGKDTHTKERIMQSLEKGKIHQDFYNEFLRITWEFPVEERELLTEKQKYDVLDYTQLVSPLPKKTIKVKKENPYYLDPDFHWLDRYKANKLKLKSTSFPVKEEYYAAEEYPQFKFYKDTYMSHRWLVYDLSGNLVAATMPTNTDLSYHGVDWQMIDACSLYDFERNAYNINQESAAVRNYVAYTLKNGRSLRSQINSAELGQAMIDKMMAEFKRRRAAGRMTQEQYNKQYQDYQKTTAENQKLLAALRKQLPSKDVIERADNYVEQLKKDNEGRLSYNYEKSRIDGLNFVLVSESGLKLQQTGYYNSKENQVEWSYKVLEK